MIVLDTNVVSELFRREPSARVMEWLSLQPREALFTTAVTQAENGRDHESQLAHALFQIVHRHPLDRVLRAAPHTLDDAGEALVAKFGLINDTGGNAYSILTNADLEKIRSISEVAHNPFKSQTLDTTWAAERGAAGLEPALQDLCVKAELAVRDGINIIILSDRLAGTDRVPMPSLLACAAVHHHLIRQGLRTSVGLVVESAEPREVHHFGCLAGYGAEAINPYLAFETLIAMHAELPGKLDKKEIVKRYIKAIDKGLLKVMSKMGISTYQSYCGAQIFDAVGLSSAFIEKYFPGNATPIEGVGLREIAEESVRRHRDAYGNSLIYRNMLDVGGDYAFRIRGEDHAWSPESVAKLQHAVRGNLPEEYRAFASNINEQNERLLTIRGLMDFKWAAAPIPLSEVEPASEIVKRFATGAMSFGSISREAHTTLAIAMNRIGGRSNTGEGGEEADRFKKMPNGDSMRSDRKSTRLNSSHRT